MLLQTRPLSRYPFGLALSEFLDGGLHLEFAPEFAWRVLEALAELSAPLICSRALAAPPPLSPMECIARSAGAWADICRNLYQQTPPPHTTPVPIAMAPRLLFFLEKQGLLGCALPSTHHLFWVEQRHQIVFVRLPVDHNNSEHHHRHDQPTHSFEHEFG